MPRNNTVRHLIDETGKIPKKEYVLHIRKLDTIKDNRRHKQTYNDSIVGDDKPISSNFNHSMIVVKNVTKEYRTVADVDSESIKHRYNYSFVPGLSNTSTHTINESGKHPKKQKDVSPRKNQIIRTEKKPPKFSYTMSEFKVGQRIPFDENSNNYNSNTNNLRNRKNLNEPRGENKKPNQMVTQRMRLPENDKNVQRNDRNKNAGNNARNKPNEGKIENSRDANRIQMESIRNPPQKNNNSNRREAQVTSKTIETTTRRNAGENLRMKRNKDDSRKGKRGEESSKIEIVIEKRSIIVDEENDSTNRRKKRNSADLIQNDNKSSKLQITRSNRNMEVRSKDDSDNGPVKKVRRYKKI